MKTLYAGAAAIIAVAVIAGGYVVTMQRTAAACGGGAVAGGLGAIGGPFELVGENGDTLTDVDVIDGPSLIYFGYTYCPDVCPFDVARNALAVDVLIEEGYDVTPIFISIDPERDTPDVVGDFAANMHPEMIGLTGTPEQVKAASKAYKTYYARGTGDDDYYLVDHSTITHLVFPQTGTAAYFPREVSPEDMAAQTACLIDAA